MADAFGHMFQELPFTISHLDNQMLLQAMESDFHKWMSKRTSDRLAKYTHAEMQNSNESAGFRCVSLGSLLMRVLKSAEGEKDGQVDFLTKLCNDLLSHVYSNAKATAESELTKRGTNQDSPGKREQEKMSTPDFARIQYVCVLCGDVHSNTASFHEHLRVCHRHRSKMSEGESGGQGEGNKLLRVPASRPESMGVPLQPSQDFLVEKEHNLTTETCGSETKYSSSGSSKRKRKLPVQYIRNSDEEPEQKRKEVCTDDMKVKKPEPCDLNSIPRSAVPAQSMYLGGPRRLVSESYLLVPGVDEECPRSVEPQPTTTICYKPSLDTSTKRKSQTCTQAEDNKEQIVKMLLKMQKDLERTTAAQKQVVMKREPLDETLHTPDPGHPHPVASSSAQTYNLDLFKRLAHKAQRNLVDDQGSIRKDSSVFGCDPRGQWMRSPPHGACSADASKEPEAMSRSPAYESRNVTCLEGLEDLEHLSQYQESHGHTSQGMSGDLQFKVTWLKQVIPRYTTVCSGGCVSRDELLEKVAGPTAVDSSDTCQWGPACNKAVREIFPDSQALRKGKYKKTYYFGVKYVSSIDNIGELPDEDPEEDLEKLSGSALRNMTQDVEKLVQLIQGLVRWTGHMDDFVARDTILQILGRRLGDSDVQNWGLQCNRAMRQHFPEVFMKRKGKFKTTCYYGVELTTKSSVWKQQPSTWSVNSNGPPVVDVRSIAESAIPAHVSRAKHVVLDRRVPLPSVKEEDVPAMFGHNSDPSDDSTSDVNDSELEAERENLCNGKAQSPSERVHIPVSERKPVSPGLKPSNFSDNIEKLILLHPGPFVTARIFSRRFQRLVPCTEKVVEAMTMLQGRGLGQLFTLKQGNSKVFFKAPPSKSLEVSLTALGVKLTDYEVVIKERDPKLEESLHGKLKTFHPHAESLATFYNF